MDNEKTNECPFFDVAARCFVGDLLPNLKVKDREKGLDMDIAIEVFASCYDSEIVARVLEK